MTTLEAAPLPDLLAEAPVSPFRRWLAPAAFALFGLVDILAFGLGSHNGDATFQFKQGSASVPDLTLPAKETCYAAGALTLVLAVVRVALPRLSLAWRRVTVVVVVFCLVIALLAWSDAGNSTPFNVTNLLSGTINLSIPLMLGALTGVVCSTSGVVNIGIEGQLLLGAFTAAIVASTTGNLWLGLMAGALAGCLVAALLAVFAIKYTVDQIIVGVVLNGFVAGLTGFLFDQLMVPNANTYNSAGTFSVIKIPGLADIPVIGPVFFDSNIFLYLTYLFIALVQVGLFQTRWGLRTRAIGEHPEAADTVGIRVLAMRYRNVIIAGVMAGIGGAYLTVGSVGTFTKDMSSGYGYIALAAMIFGRYRPFGAVAAGLLFGFCTQLQSLLSTLGVPVNSNLLLMAPYVVTIVVVAGLVGKVRPPAAEGKPYIKS